MPALSDSQVVVVGGGVAGCTIAWELARRGIPVRLLEREHIAFGASGRNLGLLLNDLAPESVAMMNDALPSYRQLAEGPVGFDLRPVDYLLLPVTGEQAGATRDMVAKMSAAGFQCEPISESALATQLPQLRPGVDGAHVVRGAWAVSPGPATRAFAEAARQAGALLETGVNVGQVVSRAGKVVGVITDRGPVACAMVVIAAGPWAADFLDVPMSTGRGWVLRTAPLPAPLPWVLVDMSWPDLQELGRVARSPSLAELAAGGYDRPAAATVSVVPQPDGRFLLGTSLAPSLRDAIEGVDMPQRLAQRALVLLPGLAGMSVGAAWSGMRPMTPDGLPLVGATHLEGVYLHGGHGSIGMQSAPGTARALADLIQGRAAPPLAGFNPGRFGPRTRPGPVTEGRPHGRPSVFAELKFG